MAMAGSQRKLLTQEMQSNVNLTYSDYLPVTQ